MNNLKGKIELKDSKLILNGLRMDVFGGSLLLNGSYETTDPSAPMMDMVLGLSDADIGEMVSHIPVMEKYAPIASKTFGRVTGNINLASVLNSDMMPVYETVKGLGNLKTSSLQIQGVNTLNALSNALQMESFRNLQLDPLNLSFQVMEGKLNVKPFDLKAGKISMNLGGWTSLSQDIGYVLNMKVPRSAFGSANTALNGLLDRANQSGTDIKLGDMVEIKALIDGTISDPKLKIDLAGTGKGLVEEVKEEIKEEVVNKVNEEAEKILAEAQARADAIMKKAQDEADKLMQNARQLADETRKQANLKADQLEVEAKDKGTLAVMAAKKAADEVRKEGDNQAKNIVSEAQKQSDNVLLKAKQESDKILQEARQKADALK
jgi:vacuolar-type H+-ATPase subunit H